MCYADVYAYHSPNGLFMKKENSSPLFCVIWAFSQVYTHIDGDIFFCVHIYEMYEKKCGKFGKFIVWNFVDFDVN